MPIENDFEIRVSATSDDEVVLQVRGELDAVSARHVGAAVAEALAVDGVQTITLDLSQLEFLDSSGIRAFLLGKLEAERAEVGWQMTGARDSTMRILQVAGVHQFLGCRTGITVESPSDPDRVAL